MLIAQAKIEGLTIVAHDSIFHHYRIPIVEA
jgi:PIN domain nuclease of toxin-antitoxin system